MRTWVLGLNLSQAADTHVQRGDERRKAAISKLESNQQEIDQRDQGSPNACGDQHIIGAEVAARIERRLR